MKSALEMAVNLDQGNDPKVKKIFYKLLDHSLSDPVIPGTPDKLKTATEEVISLLDGGTGTENSQTQNRQDSFGTPPDKFETQIRTSTKEGGANSTGTGQNALKPKVPQVITPA